MKTILKTAVVILALAGQGLAMADEPTPAQRKAQAKEFLARGLIQKSQGNEEAALALFQLAFALDQENERVLTELAFLYNDDDDYWQGLLFARLALKLNGENAEALREAGYALWKGGENSELAIATFWRALAANPRDWVVYSYLEDLLRECGRLNEIETLRNKLEIEQKKAEI
jgi:Flp pilus assembly protein TadD